MNRFSGRIRNGNMGGIGEGGGQNCKILNGLPGGPAGWTTNVEGSARSGRIRGPVTS